MFFKLFTSFSCCPGLVFVQWSNGCWRDPIFPPTVSKVGARFWNAHSWPEIFQFAPRVLCDDSYGAAHKPIWSHRKHFKNQLIFNNFVLWHASRNKTFILSAGFSLLFDKASFSRRRRMSFYHRNLHVQILTCFAQWFWWFCFDACMAMLAAKRFSLRLDMPKLCFKTALSLKW